MRGTWLVGFVLACTSAASAQNTHGARNGRQPAAGNHTHRLPWAAAPTPNRSPSTPQWSSHNGRARRDRRTVTPSRSAVWAADAGHECGIGTSGAVTGTAPAGSSSSGVSGYRLSGVDMTSWVGKRVQLVGTVVPRVTIPGLALTSERQAQRRGRSSG